MPGVGAEYARLPVTEIADDLSSDDEDDLYTRPPRRHKPKAARNGKNGLQTAPAAFREAATRPVKRYQLLDEEDALGALQAIPDIRQPRPSSLTKKACLVTCCLIILTGISVAVWLVPCQWYGCSDSTSGPQQSSVRRDYEVMFPGIVVTTRVQVTPTVYMDSADVVLGFRRQDSTAGGVMVVASGGGDKLWQQDLYEAPVDLQCGGLDLNGNGVFECLATGSSSLMALINMDKRRVEWYLHEHNSTARSVSLLPPLLLNDLTSDGVADILAAGLLREEEEDSDELQSRRQPPRTQLMLADGATGMVLNRGPIPGCPVLLRMWTDDSPSDLNLECMAPESGVAPRTEPLTALTEQLRTDDMPADVTAFTAQDSEAEEEDGWMFQVQLENAGVCPGCRGRLSLLDTTGGAVWSTSPERSRLHSVRRFSHRNHSGVIYKQWQYPTDGEIGPLAPLHRSRRWWSSVEDPEQPVPTLAFEEEASVTQTSAGIEFRYRHPGLEGGADGTGAVTAEPDDDSVPEFFTESVHVVWPAEDGQFRTRQLDSVQVTRFCRERPQRRCEPAALPDNVATAAVVDVGSDGDLDLVSVTSLYVPEGEVVVPRHRHQCSLQTRLRKRQLYGPHWQETLSRDTLSETGHVSGEIVSESVPTEETALP